MGKPNGNVSDAYCIDWFGAVAFDCGDDDVNQFRRYGSRFVFVVVLLANTDKLFDMPLLPVFVGVRPLNSGDAVGAFPWTWALVNWMEPIPLPADATELIDAPTIDVFDIFCCVAFEYWLIAVDHADVSSSTISTQSSYFLFGERQAKYWCY